MIVFLVLDEAFQLFSAESALLPEILKNICVFADGAYEATYYYVFKYAKRCDYKFKLV